MRTALNQEIDKRIYANESIPDVKGIYNTWLTRVKKLLNLLEARQWMGKRKKERPHKWPIKCEERPLLTGIPRYRRQSAWTSKEEETQPITVHMTIQGKKINALVDSGADENYIHWKLARKLGIWLRKKREPYILCGVEGKETSYNKGMVTIETGPITLQLNKRYWKENFDITELGDHQILLGRR